MGVDRYSSSQLAEGCIQLSKVSVNWNCVVCVYMVLIRFLKLAPFNDFTVWKEMVQKKST